LLLLLLVLPLVLFVAGRPPDLVQSVHNGFSLLLCEDASLGQSLGICLTALGGEGGTTAAAETAAKAMVGSSDRYAGSCCRQWCSSFSCNHGPTTTHRRNVLHVLLLHNEAFWLKLQVGFCWWLQMGFWCLTPFHTPSLSVSLTHPDVFGPHAFVQWE